MHDLSLYLLELLENSVRAGATRVAVTLAVDRRADLLALTVEDDGPGLPVPPDAALDPFYTTKPGKKTGLGLSLLRQEAEAAGGGLSVSSSERLGGTAVEARMSLTNVDRPPAGDVALSILTMTVTNPEVAFSVELREDGQLVVLGRETLPARLDTLRAFQRSLD